MTKQTEAAKATPGPWVTGDEVNNRSVYCDDATGSIVATCHGFPYAPRPRAEQEANARLIAAAPDLLAALQAMVWVCVDPQGSESGKSLAVALAEILPNARAALAKAVTP